MTATTLPVSLWGPKSQTNSHAEEEQRETRTSGQWEPRQWPRQSPVTLRFAERLLNLDDLLGEQIALKQIRCATSCTGWQCGHCLCPRCSARVAKRRRAEVERELRALPPGVHVALVTLTTGTDEINEGREILFESFSTLRRRVAWSSVVIAGRGQIELLPAVGASRKWNLHFHVLVYLLRERVAVRALREAWRGLLEGHGLPSSLTWSSDPKRFAPAREGGRGATFLAGGFLRHEEDAKRVARRDRRGDARNRARGTRPKWAVRFGRAPGARDEAPSR